MTDFAKTPLNKVRRIAERGQYDRETIYAIVDEAKICHVGFSVEGQPFVIPTIHARHEDILYLHGAKASRLLKHIEAGNPICVSITLLDGLVLARSVFHSSMNYRSVVLFGTGVTVQDEAEKWHALEVVTNHVAEGRWDDARKPTPKEMNATTVVAISLESASAKIRVGAPGDDEEDYDLPIWAGVLPLRQQALELIPDPRLNAGIPVPNYLSKLVSE